MASYVNELIHSAGGNLARPTKFTTNLSIPSSITRDIGSDAMDILCKSFAVPAIKTENVEYKYRGHTIPIVGRVVYDHTVSITFILDEDHVLRTVFKDWIEALDTSILGDISNNSQGLSERPQHEQTGVLRISALNWKEDREVIDYSFTEVYPVSVSGPEFQTDSVSTMLECTVEFAFVSMTSKPTGSLDISNIFNKTVDKVIGTVEGAVEGAVANLFSQSKSSSTDGFTVTYNKGGGDFFTLYGGN